MSLQKGPAPAPAPMFTPTPAPAPVPSWESIQAVSVAEEPIQTNSASMTMTFDDISEREDDSSAIDDLLGDFDRATTVQLFLSPQSFLVKAHS